MKHLAQNLGKNKVSITTVKSNFVEKLKNVKSVNKSGFNNEVKYLNDLETSDTSIEGKFKIILGEGRIQDEENTLLKLKNYY